MTPSGLTLKLALLALVCYGMYARRTPSDATIEVAPGRIDAIAEEQEELLGRALAASERERIEASYIEEELLVREAYRRGFDRADRRVRPMLIDHARRELLRAAGYEAPTPSTEELRSYFEEHAARFRIPERLDLDQVLYPAGGAPPELDAVLAELRLGADFTTLGTAGPGANVRGVSRAEMAQGVGLDVATAVFGLGEREWHGPFTSAVGTHFFRVRKRWPSREPSFEDVLDYLEADYSRAAEDRIVDAELERVRRRYHVDIEDVE